MSCCINEFKRKLRNDKKTNLEMPMYADVKCY